jgi:hypothetical protein
MRYLFRICSALAGAAAVALSTSAVYASTAANTQIVNTATLTYTGGSKTATALVTVSLVPAQPTLFLNGNTGGYISANNPSLGDSLLLTSNANGPATYHVTAAIGAGANAPTNTTGASVSDGGGFDVPLGASVTTATATNQSTTTTLVIPAPDATHITGGPGTYNVNGIGVNSTVSFATYARAVTAITQNGDNTFTLTLSSAIPAAVPAGTPVYEQKTVSGITTLPGTIVSLGTDIHVYAQATVTTASVAAVTSNWADNKWTSASPNVQLIKYTRNVTSASANPTAGGCFTSKTTFTVNGAPNDFFPCGVTGKTGDTLEYVVFAGNTSTTSDLSGSAISDNLPTAYVTFKLGAYGGGGNDVFYSPDGTGGGGSGSLQVGALNANQASITPWPIPTPNPPSVALNVNVGTGATVANGGTIAKAAAAGGTTALFIAYQVTIK